jgi:hypothetical protein
MKSLDRRGRDGERWIRRDRGARRPGGRRSVAPCPAGSPRPMARCGPRPGAGPHRPRTAGRLHAGREPSQQAIAREHAMSLSRCEQSRLRRIEASLCRPDPKLAGMLGVFGGLLPGQRMPAREQAVPARPDPAGGCLARGGCRRSRRGPPPACRDPRPGRDRAGGRARPSASETGAARRSRETSGRPDLAGWGRPPVSTVTAGGDTGPGTSAGVADLAASAARLCGLPGREIVALRRAPPWFTMSASRCRRRSWTSPGS